MVFEVLLVITILLFIDNALELFSDEMIFPNNIDLLNDVFLFIGIVLLTEKVLEEFIVGIVFEVLL